jgi:ABC-2 type transport system ATP-binding protein
VNDVSFVVRSGECLGLLGPNGAGKTTSISIITGLLKADAGTVLIEGRPLSSDTDPLKHKLGLVPQEIALYEPLTGYDNLRLFGALYGLEGRLLQDRMDEALMVVGLRDRAKEKIRGFSGGMKRRLNLAAALMHDPQILLLDEPTVGVDPQSRNAIFENIEELRKRGKTIIYTTHYMEEVERLCDRVIIIDHGKVVADDTLAGLKKRTDGVQRLRIELAAVSSAEWLPAVCGLDGVRNADLKNNCLTVEVEDLNRSTTLVMDCLRQHGQRCLHLQSEAPNLESVFLNLTGHTLRDL